MESELLTIRKLKKQIEDLFLEAPETMDCYVSTIKVNNKTFLYIPGLVHSDLMGKAVFEDFLLE